MSSSGFEPETSSVVSISSTISLYIWAIADEVDGTPSKVQLYRLAHRPPQKGWEGNWWPHPEWKPEPIESETRAQPPELHHFQFLPLPRRGNGKRKYDSFFPIVSVGHGIPSSLLFSFFFSVHSIPIIKLDSLQLNEERKLWFNAIPHPYQLCVSVYLSNSIK